MTKHGQEFGVDLDRLWRCATIDLMAISARIASANAGMAGGSNDSGAFGEWGTVPGTGGHASAMIPGPIWPHWDKLRDEVQRVLAESVQNVYDSADALIQIMHNYAEGDTAAKAELDARIADFKSRHWEGIDFWEKPDDRPKVTMPE
jgi:hypothetical protein